MTRKNARFIRSSHTTNFLPLEADLGDGFTYVSLYDAKIGSNMTRKNARFIRSSHTTNFLPLEADLGDGFTYVSLYDAKIGPNLIVTRNGILVISNSYLSSFAYNLGLSVLYDQQNGKDLTTDVSSLLKYNFKKFYAEQLLSVDNTVFGRAIFLETLVYEQFSMIPVFSRVASDQSFHDTAEKISNVVANLILFHEMGHYYIDHRPIFWEELERQYGGIFRPLLDELQDNQSAIMVMECRCDFAALFLSLLSVENDADKRGDFLRMVAFSYGCYAVMFCLERSALKTIESNKATSLPVDLSSIEKTDSDAMFDMEADPEMIFRARQMIILCELVAESWQIDLYNSTGNFILKRDFLLPLLNYVNHITEPDNIQERGLALLLAESYHGHPGGIDYLIGRSQIFKNVDVNTISSQNHRRR